MRSKNKKEGRKEREAEGNLGTERMRNTERTEEETKEKGDGKKEGNKDRQQKQRIRTSKRRKKKPAAERRSTKSGYKIQDMCPRERTTIRGARESRKR